LNTIQPVFLGERPPGALFAPVTVAPASGIAFFSGQVATGDDGRLVGLGDPTEQARQCLRNLDALLAALGAEPTSVARLVVYLVDVRHREAVAEARREYFGKHTPASTLIEVSALVHPDYLVEIEATALIGIDRGSVRQPA
jgi:2-iminobutanoate/2-iminopropanoate deaminase